MTVVFAKKTSFLDFAEQNINIFQQLQTILNDFLRTCEYFNFSKTLFPLFLMKTLPTPYQVRQCWELKSTL